MKDIYELYNKILEEGEPVVVNNNRFLADDLFQQPEEKTIVTSTGQVVKGKYVGNLDDVFLADELLKLGEPDKINYLNSDEKKTFYENLAKTGYNENFAFLIEPEMREHGVNPELERLKQYAAKPEVEPTPQIGTPIGATDKVHKKAGEFKPITGKEARAKKLMSIPAGTMPQFGEYDEEWQAAVDKTREFLAPFVETGADIIEFLKKPVSTAANAVTNVALDTASFVAASPIAASKLAGMLVSPGDYSINDYYEEMMKVYDDVHKKLKIEEAKEAMGTKDRNVVQDVLMAPVTIPIGMSEYAAEKIENPDLKGVVRFSGFLSSLAAAKKSAKFLGPYMNPESLEFQKLKAIADEATKAAYRREVAIKAGDEAAIAEQNRILEELGFAAKDVKTEVEDNLAQTTHYEKLESESNVSDESGKPAEVAMLPEGEPVDKFVSKKGNVYLKYEDGNWYTPDGKIVKNKIIINAAEKSLVEKKVEKKVEETKVEETKVEETKVEEPETGETIEEPKVEETKAVEQPKKKTFISPKGTVYELNENNEWINTKTGKKAGNATVKLINKFYEKLEKPEVVVEETKTEEGLAETVPGIGIKGKKLYHGSSGDFESAEEMPKGHRGYFGTESIDVAKRFGDKIYEITLNTDEIFDPNNPTHEKYIDMLYEKVKHLYKNKKRFVNELKKGTYSYFENPQVTMALEDLGFKGNIQTEKGSTVVRLFNKSDFELRKLTPEELAEVEAKSAKEKTGKEKKKLVKSFNQLEEPTITEKQEVPPEVSEIPANTNEHYLREKDPETTRKLKDVYGRTKVSGSQNFLARLINAANAWLDNDDTVDIDKLKETIIKFKDHVSENKKALLMSEFGGRVNDYDSFIKLLDDASRWILSIKDHDRGKVEAAKTAEAPAETKKSVVDNAVAETVKRSEVVKKEVVNRIDEIISMIKNRLEEKQEPEIEALLRATIKRLEVSKTDKVGEYTNGMKAAEWLNKKFADTLEALGLYQEAEVARRPFDVEEIMNKIKESDIEPSATEAGATEEVSKKYTKTSTEVEVSEKGKDVELKARTISDETPAEEDLDVIGKGASKRGFKLYSMIPVDQIPDLVLDFIKGSNKLARYIKDNKLLDIRPFLRNREIFNATGFWYNRYLGKWMYEIPISENDISFNVIPRNVNVVPLMSLLRGPEVDKLFNKFPILYQYRVVKKPDLNVGGSVNVVSHTISLKDFEAGIRTFDGKYHLYNPKKTLMHEVQHIIQDTIGRQQNILAGSSINIEKFREYRMQTIAMLNEAIKTLEEKGTNIPFDVRDKLIELKRIRDELSVDKTYKSKQRFDDILSDNKNFFERIGYDDIASIFSKGLKELTEDEILTRYFKDPGELEAFLVERRLSMTPEERRRIPPWETLNNMLHEYRRGGYKYGPEVGLSLYSFEAATGKAVTEAAKAAVSKAKKIVEYSRRFKDESKVGLFDFFRLGVKEGAEGVKEAVKSIPEYMAVARTAKNKSWSDIRKELRESFVRGFVEKSGNLRRELLKHLNDDGYKVVQRMYLARGGVPYAMMKFNNMAKEVYSGLNSRLREILDNYILVKRMEDLWRYKDPKKFRAPEALNKENVENYMKNFEDIEGLSPQEAELIKSRAEAYFGHMRNILKDALDEGIISQEEFEKLSSHDYRTLKVVDNIDQVKEVTVGKGQKITVRDSGIKPLVRGKETDIFDPSSKDVALEHFVRIYNRILRNKAVSELVNIARKYSSNAFARLPKKEGGTGKIPRGWQPITYYEGGERKRVYVSPLVVKEFIVSKPEMSYRLALLLRIASGTAAVNLFATGINFGFAVANLPKDIINIWHTSRIFKDGRWRPLYSVNFPTYAAQMINDISHVAFDVLTKRGLFEKYIESGGGMEFLAMEGLLRDKYHVSEGPFDTLIDILSAAGRFSEGLTRTAIFRRAILEEAKRLGISFEEALERDDVRAKAAFSARDYLDFGQGGSVTGALSNVIPYFNASVQATRGMLRVMKDNPLEFMYRQAQYAALVFLIELASQQYAKKTMDDIEGSYADRNNLIIPFGDKFGFRDSDGNFVYPFLKVPLDPTQRFFKFVYRAAARKYLGYDVNTEHLVSLLKELSPVPDASSTLPPILSAALGYVSNKDYWKNSNIWSEETFNWPRSREEFDYKTPQIYVDLGKITGLSPERMKYAFEELTAGGDVYLQTIYGVYDSLFKEMPEDTREMTVAQIFSEIYPSKRFIGLTNPYSKMASKISEWKEDEVFKNFVEDRNFDSLVHAYFYNKELGITYNDLQKEAAKYKDIDIYDRLMNRYKWELAVSMLPDDKTFWRALKGSSPRVRAMAVADRLEKGDEEDRKKLWNEIAVMSRVEGVITDDFREHLAKIIRDRGISY